MKPRIAFFDFASCEGDQLQVVNLEENLLALLEHVDVVSFREAMKEHSDQYDIAFIEGSIARPADEERLKKIRANATYLVALGSCATIGGINAIRNFQNLEDVRKYVYGDKWQDYDAEPTKPVDAVVKVDAYVHGCPIGRNEFLSIVKAMLLGKKPPLPNYPVCVECKLAGNVCVFEKGEFCMGPVTRAGCSACCVTEGSICWGCRGFVDNPNAEAHHEVLEKYGLKAQDVINKFRLYGGCSKEVK